LEEVETEVGAGEAAAVAALEEDFLNYRYDNIYNLELLDCILRLVPS
jgi:hypothetical protein